MSKPNDFTKDGLTGTSGFGVEGLPGIWHINANYAATEGNVFVEVESAGEWERMKETDAVEQKRRVIPCTYCAKPAISLDHSWPYLTEATYCADHRDWQRWATEAETDLLHEQDPN